MGNRINTVMQPCFFQLAGVLPADEAIARIKGFVEKTYAKRGEAVVAAQLRGHRPLARAARPVSRSAPSRDASDRASLVPATRPDFVARRHRPADGRRRRPPAGQRAAGRRHVPDRHDQVREARHRPDDPDLGRVDLHRLRQVRHGLPARLDPDEGLPGGRGRGRAGRLPEQGVQVARAARPPADDPGRARTTAPAAACASTSARPRARPRSATRRSTWQPVLEHRDVERERWDFFQSIPPLDREPHPARHDQGLRAVLEPLFEFSGACGGCGETPYLRLVTQLFGDRMIVANATGCSSIYGANLPTTPWTTNAEGRGPAWANSLFEDNAEFGLGHAPRARRPDRASRARLLTRLAPVVGEPLVRELLDSPQDTEPEIVAQRERRGAPARRPRRASTGADADDARQLVALSGDLVRQGIWIVGGDGWAYDIGFGGLDQVLSSGRNVNILVLDTEVYSNTGGQASQGDAARRRRQVRGGRQGHRQEGPRRDRPRLRQRLRGPGVDGRQRRPDDRRRCSRPTPGRGRRWSSPTAPASRTASTCRSRCPTRRTPSRAATGRSTASSPARSRTASRSSSTRRSRRIPIRRLRGHRDPVRDPRAHRPRAGRGARRRWPRPTPTSAGATTSSWPASTGACRTSHARPTLDGGAGVEAVGRERRREGRPGMSIDLRTRYLGLDLRSPLVASASPLTGELATARRARGGRRGRDRAAVAVRGGDPQRGARAQPLARGRARSSSPRRSTTSRRSTSIADAGDRYLDAPRAGQGASSPCRSSPASTRRRPAAGSATRA